MNKTLKKETFKVMKDGEFVEVEIDEEANEANVRKIQGLMVQDQVIDVFKDTVFKVGKANKRLYEKVPHK